MILIEQSQITSVVNQALIEDLGTVGDITSQAIFAVEDRATAIIKSKSSGVVSGCYLLTSLFKTCDQTCTVEVCCKDGASLQPGTVIAKIEGSVCGILAAERVALNFLQRLSGIATITAQYVAAIAHTHAQLLDTRKTTPLLRVFEKAAVFHGGGVNHRIGLFDMILIKDTHVKRAGGAKLALEKALHHRGDRNEPAIEIEVQCIEEFRDVIELQPDRIMLDNMSLDAMRYCAEYRTQRSSAVELEASGNVQLTTIAAIAETGVDYISVGAITHSVTAMDIHLIIQ